MSEDGEIDFTPNKIKYIEVPVGVAQSGIKAVPYKTSLYDVEMSVDIDRAARFILTGKTLQEIESEMRASSLPLPERIRQGVGYAQNQLNSILQEVGCNPIKKPEEILFLKPDHLKKFYQEYFGIKDFEDAEYSGGQIDVFEPVIIVDDDILPDFFKTAMYLHEDIHKHLEYKTRTFSRPFADCITTQGARLGLRVPKVQKSSEGTLEKLGNVGVLVNELPNYFYQMEFVRWILNSKEGRELYTDEVELQESAKRLLRLEPNGRLVITLGDVDAKIIIDERNAIFFNDGKFRLNTPELAAQLMDDLEKLVGEIDRKPMHRILLEAKVNPKLQSKIKKVVDEKLGNGFFRKLKNSDADPESIANLLIEVQSKLLQEEEVANET